MIRIYLEKNVLGGYDYNNAPAYVPVPDGWAVVPDDIEIPESFPFVNIEVANDDEGRAVVVSMTAGVVPDPDPEPEPEPTEEDDTAAMLVDHEYRLTLLELGLTE